MDSVNKTLYIPLYAKAYVSRKGILLQDKKAEELWHSGGFPLRGKSRSKWLAYYLGMRAAIFDNWVTEQLSQNPDAVVLHIGCGLDSRVLRVNPRCRCWYDIDFPEVIAERRRFYPETDTYRMIAGDARESGWLAGLPKDCPAIVIMEGISMYLKPEQTRALLAGLRSHFPRVALLTDCYTRFAAKASKYKNPVKEVGVTQVYGIDDPEELIRDTGLAFVRQHDMTPEDMICQLRKSEQFIFRKVYGGKMSRNLYRMYEYQSE